MGAREEVAASQPREKLPSRWIYKSRIKISLGTESHALVRYTVVGVSNKAHPSANEKYHF